MFIMYHMIQNKGEAKMPCFLGKRTTSEKKYLEQMSKVIFRVGLSYKVVDAKWPSIKRAFKNFNVDEISKISEEDLENYLEDKDLIRNFTKLNSIVLNANIIQEIKSEYKTLNKFILLESKNTEKEFINSISKKFNQLGPTTTVYFLRSVGFELKETMKLKQFSK